MSKTTKYEVCYLGGRFGSTRSYKFRITQITIIDPPLEPFTLEEKEFPIPPTLIFRSCPVKNLRIGDYLTTETGDDKIFKNFQRCVNPEHPLSQDEILVASMEEKAKMLEKRALNAFRTGTEDVDAYIDKIRNAMWDLNKSQRAAFALYIYQRLSK